MKMAISAVPEVQAPPTTYEGVEHIVVLLVSGMHDRGHEVVLLSRLEIRRH